MFLIIQILLFDTDLNCVVLAAAYAVLPSRTNLLLVAVLCWNKAAFKIELVNSHKYSSEFFCFETRYFNYLSYSERQ